MKKIVNFRFWLTVIVSMIIFIIAATKIFVAQNSKMILLYVLLGLFLIDFVLSVILKKKILISILGVLIFVIISCGLICYRSNALIKNQSLNVENYSFSGKIYNLTNNFDDGYIKIYLTNVSAKSENSEQNIDGKILLYVAKNNLDTSKYKIGKIVTVSSKISFLTLQDENLDKSISYISRGISGTSFAYPYLINVSENAENLTLRDKIRNEIYEDFSNSNSIFSNVGYAMIFGDSSVLDENVKSVFEDSGTAHLLAVSGFHISIIVVFLSFILDKLKIKKWLKCLIIALILTFYVYICDFSVSVIRASAMAILSLFALYRCKNYDTLSALSFAGCLILIISPIYVFNVSFVLSFLSVLSIVLLKPLFDRLFEKFLYPKIATMLSLSISVGIGLFFTQLYYFGSAPLLSFVSNILTVPIISLLYVLLLIALVLSSVIPFCLYFIEVFGMLMKYILQINNFVAKISISLSFEISNPLIIFVSAAFMLFVSDYVFLNRKTKIFGSCVFVGILGALLIF